MPILGWIRQKANQLRRRRRDDSEAAVEETERLLSDRDTAGTDEETEPGAEDHDGAGTGGADISESGKAEAARGDEQATTAADEVDAATRSTSRAIADQLSAEDDAGRDRASIVDMLKAMMVAVVAAEPPHPMTNSKFLVVLKLERQQQLLLCH